ncbi:MAG: Bax inhibitor-1 family protein [Candidatus Obscuribacterales bacterium]|jgi:FtsH-binding integral membrane protein|nr:Bax inhibitor-1 family protein [Candidatus Obscuribacterales bacterium]
METLIAKVAVLLSMTMGLGTLGVYLGREIKSFGAFIGLAIAFVVGAIGVIFAASISPMAGITALAVWALISGLFTGPAIQLYADKLGWQTVAGAFAGTSGVMAVCGSIGLFSGADFSSMGFYLGIALFGLIIVSVIGLFWRMSREMNIGMALVGMVIFAGYFIFDFWRLGNSENTWAKAIELTLNIYLDFLNFFLRLLELLALLSNKS